MKPINTNYTEEHLKQIIQEDLRVILVKDKEYGRSWLKRGGVGAFIMLARKWDRIEEQVKRTMTSGTETANSWNVFSHIFLDQRPEGIIDDIQDLRRYLILVEAACLASEPTSIPDKSQTDNQSIATAPLLEPYPILKQDPRTTISKDGMEHPFGFDKTIDCI